jgi:hypothetical protein
VLIIEAAPVVELLDVALLLVEELVLGELPVVEELLPSELPAP